MKLKKIAFILLLIIVTFILVGCAECINTEYADVEVIIVDTYHRSMWMQPIRVGNTTTYITYPAEWKIIVEYDGVKYRIDNIDTYNKYKTKIGQTATGKLIIKTFDDGTIKYNIISLE